jgi:hypothetical protein
MSSILVRKTASLARTAFRNRTSTKNIGTAFMQSNPMFGKSPHHDAPEDGGRSYVFDEHRRTSRVSCVTAMRRRDGTAMQAADLRASDTRSSHE